MLPLLIVLLTERLYNSSLYSKSLEDIPKMQEISKLKKFFNAAAALGSPPMTIVFYVGTINLMPKPAALYMWCAMTFTIYLTNTMKSFYGEDRPYWVSDDIQGQSCKVSFGNPSGILMNNVFMWTTIYLHAYYEVGVR